MSHLHLIDDKGFPVILADEPKLPEPKPIAPSTRPSAINHDEWARRQDAVREAAREFEELKQQDIKERLRGVTSKPLDDSDIAQFQVDIRAQVLDDLVDVLDQRQRGVLRGRRMVRVVQPKGYQSKILRTLTQLEADQVSARLKARGWSDADIKSSFIDKLKHLVP